MGGSRLYLNISALTITHAHSARITRHCIPVCSIMGDICMGDSLQFFLNFRVYNAEAPPEHLASDEMEPFSTVLNQSTSRHSTNLLTNFKLNIRAFLS